MSDDPNTDLETEAVTPDEESPDQPEDLGALKRALEREREDRKAAKEELRRWNEDEGFLREKLSARGFEFDDNASPDEPDGLEYEDDEPDEPGRDSELNARLEAIERDRAIERFHHDLNQVAEGRAVGEQALAWIAQQTAQNGNDRPALEKAVTEWFEFEDSLRTDGVQQLRESKKAPRTPVRGTQTTDKVPDLSDRNARRAWMLERAQATAQQQ